ncbi:MAG: putative manganese transporter [Clostridia bacterium]|jgi:hypothetical protein|nr:putative manganese transporter [Clostridia bacterium]MDD3232106.1 putative manganese transporter [Clostridia bacterium]MDD3862573.1 putative manganese transporter [Clostridia bacterium]MDD4408740.1 putative manganese transporter [Clostridia bacterium]
MIWEIILETLTDTLKAVPILFIVYLLVEFFSHKKREQAVTKVLGKYGPLMSGAIGCIPQCGFSAAMADLYSRQKITIGTLFAVFLATSDEAIAILIAHPEFYGYLFLLIAIKFVAAVVFGYLLDFFVNKSQPLKDTFKNSNNVNVSENNDEENDNRDLEHTHSHKCASCCGKSCTESIFFNTLIHVLKIATLLFIVALILNLMIEWIGEEQIKLLLGGGEVFAIFIAALIGLVPTCGISVIFASLFISGIISFATLVAALCAGTGLGLVVLLTKNRKNVKENIFIILLLYLVSVLIGMIVHLIGLF